MLASILSLLELTQALVLKIRLLSINALPISAIIIVIVIMIIVITIININTKICIFELYPYLRA